MTYDREPIVPPIWVPEAECTVNEGKRHPVDHETGERGCWREADDPHDDTDE